MALHKEMSFTELVFSRRHVRWTSCASPKRNLLHVYEGTIVTLHQGHGKRKEI